MSAPTKPFIVIFTDGSAYPNPGPGGWGALLIDQTSHREKELSGSEPDTTNNRMELKAAVEALRALKVSCQVELFTDSQYLQLGITEWMDKWIKNNWRTADRKPVKNQDLWQELNREAHRHFVHWRWVRGHAGNECNERVDQLAGDARRKVAQE
jgi:ribonuclease HI